MALQSFLKKVFLIRDAWCNDSGIKQESTLPKKPPHQVSLFAFWTFTGGWRRRRCVGIFFPPKIFYLFGPWNSIIGKVTVPLKDLTDTNCCGWWDLSPSRRLSGRRVHQPLSFPNHDPFPKVALNPELVCGRCSDHSSLNWCTCPDLVLILEYTHIHTINLALNHLCFSDSSQLAVLDFYVSFCANLLSQGYCEQVNAFTSFISIEINCWIVECQFTVAIVQGPGQYTYI